MPAASTPVASQPPSQLAFAAPTGFDMALFFKSSGASAKDVQAVSAAAVAATPAKGGALTAASLGAQRGGASMTHVDSSAVPLRSESAAAVDAAMLAPATHAAVDVGAPERPPGVGDEEGTSTAATGEPAAYAGDTLSPAGDAAGTDIADEPAQPRALSFDDVPLSPIAAGLGGARAAVPRAGGSTL